MLIGRLHIILWSVLVGLTCALAAETPAGAARQFTTAHQTSLTQEFSEFLSIPNVAADPANLKRNADLLVGALKKRGVESRLLSIPGAPPVVYGQITVPGARHTIVFYAHYDGQAKANTAGIVAFNTEVIGLRSWTRGPATGSIRKMSLSSRLTACITCATRCIQASTLHSASHLSSIGCGEEAHSTDGYWRGSIAWARAIRFWL